MALGAPDVDAADGVVVVVLDAPDMGMVGGVADGVALSAPEVDAADGVASTAPGARAVRVVVDDVASAAVSVPDVEKDAVDGMPMLVDAKAPCEVDAVACGTGNHVAGTPHSVRESSMISSSSESSSRVRFT